MNIKKFRSDFLRQRDLQGLSYAQVAREYAICYVVLYNFSLARRGLSFENVIKLWPFVYGCEFPSPPSPTASPTTVPEPAQEQHHA